MDEYTTRIARRQRVSVAVHAVFLVSLLVSIAMYQEGANAVAIVLVAWLLLGLALPTAISWRNRRVEALRRRDGAAPGWPAQLPMQYAHRAGNPRSGADGNGSLPGRLTYADGVFSWEPSRVIARNLKVQAGRWDSSWMANVVSTFPWLNQGVLTLRARDGDVVHIRVRNCDDLKRQLRSQAASSNP